VLPILAWRSYLSVCVSLSMCVWLCPVAHVAVLGGPAQITLIREHENEPERLGQAERFFLEVLSHTGSEGQRDDGTQTHTQGSVCG
jgi:hypothetical protein